MSIGIRISKPGIDVKTADKKDLIFDSELVSMKIWKEGSGNGIGSITIPHEASFTPMFLAYAELDNNKVFSIGQLGRGDNNLQVFTGYTDTTNLNLSISGATKRNYYYYILGDTSLETGTQTLFQEEFGLKISKPFKDVNSGILEEINITSEKPPLKLYKQGNVGIDSDSVTILEIPHDLPFIPAFFVMGKRADETTWSLLPFSLQDGRTLYAYSTPSTLVIRAFPGLEGGVYNFKYLIFGNRARD